MKDFIFIIGPSAVGKTTLAKGLFEYYEGVYIEQNMVPEFSIPKTCEDVGVYEEKVCWENTLMQIEYFRQLGYKNIIALDFDDLRTGEIPKVFKGTDFITLKLISSNPEQIKRQMQKRHDEGEGLYDLEHVEVLNKYIRQRALLPNEVEVDVCRKSEEEMLKQAIYIIDNHTSVINYDYELPEKELFNSWVKSNGLKRDDEEA